MPVREVARNYRSVTGKLSSQKNGRLVQFESTLERDFFRLQEFDPRVAAYEEQPVRLWVGERMDREPYVPDALVTYVEPGVPMLVEVKYSDELRIKWCELRPKIIAAREYAHQRKWRFRIWTEKNIRTARLANATRLLPYRLPTVDAESCYRVLRFVREHKSVRVNHIIGEWPFDCNALTVVQHLLATGQLKFDFSIPFSVHSLLEVP